MNGYDAVTHYDWPPAEELHDRDTITVDRVVDDPHDGPAHRFVIKRGDTVRAYMRNDEFHTGIVIGISHAENRVRVSWSGHTQRGGWWKVGAIYPALEPQPVPITTGYPSSANVTLDDSQQVNPLAQIHILASQRRPVIVAGTVPNVPTRMLAQSSWRALEWL